jgi:hypothetical protein
MAAKSPSTKMRNRFRLIELDKISGKRYFDIILIQTSCLVVQR